MKVGNFINEVHDIVIIQTQDDNYYVDKNRFHSNGNEYVPIDDTLVTALQCSNLKVAVITPGGYVNSNIKFNDIQGN